MSPDRARIAGVLAEIATCLEFQDENPFRVRAFRTAATAVEGLATEPSAALADGSLAATKGIGPAILAVVKQVVETGRSDVLDQLREKVSPGMLEMLGIPGLGISRIRAIRDQLGIDTLAALEEAARDGRLARLPGFGAKTAEKVLKGLGYLATTRAYRLSFHAAQEAEAVRSALAGLPGVVRVVVAGEVRRRCEVVRDLDLVVVTESPASAVLGTLARLAEIEAVAEGDERRATVRSPGGMTTRVIATPAVNLGAVLVQATGSERHLELLAAHAAARAFTLNAAALWKGNAFVPTPDEAALYHALGLAEIPPELREGGDEVSRAAAGPLPPLVEQSDLAGLLHCHSTYSDGALGIEELALACRAAGYFYLGLSDHSKSAAYAGGLSPDDLRDQWAEVDAINARLSGIRILKGIESDILADGSLDYDDATLAGFDFVIGSIHSRFAMNEAEMTERLLRAMRSPYLTILGHPTGRLLLAREPYPMDLTRIFAEAASRRVAIEINGDPRRLDLDWRLVKRARELGVVLSIGADAHDRAGIGNMASGVGMARKGGLTRDDVLNARGVDGFLEFARVRRA